MTKLSTLLLCIISLQAYAMQQYEISEEIQFGRNGTLIINNTTGNITVKMHSKESVIIKIIQYIQKRDGIQQTPEIHCSSFEKTISLKTIDKFFIPWNRDNNINHYEISVPDQTHIKLETCTASTMRIDHYKETSWSLHGERRTTEGLVALRNGNSVHSTDDRLYQKSKL